MTEVTTIDSLSAATQVQGQVLAGGTLLMREVNYRPETVPHLVRVTDLSLIHI